MPQYPNTRLTPPAPLPSATAPENGRRCGARQGPIKIDTSFAGLAAAQDGQAGGQVAHD